MPHDFAAAYSDYHVTGLNPAGNATLTDEAFIAARFRIAQSRRPGGMNATGVALHRDAAVLVWLRKPRRPDSAGTESTHNGGNSNM